MIYVSRVTQCTSVTLMKCVTCTVTQKIQRMPKNTRKYTRCKRLTRPADPVVSTYVCDTQVFQFSGPSSNRRKQGRCTRLLKMSENKKNILRIRQISINNKQVGPLLCLRLLTGVNEVIGQIMSFHVIKRHFM
jgi:hypothetical protein